MPLLSLSFADLGFSFLAHGFDPNHTAVVTVVESATQATVSWRYRDAGTEQKSQVQLYHSPAKVPRNASIQSALKSSRGATVLSLLFVQRQYQPPPSLSRCEQTPIALNDP
jgi:hypothetical protein